MSLHDYLKKQDELQRKLDRLLDFSFPHLQQIQELENQIAKLNVPDIAALSTLNTDYLTNLNIYSQISDLSNAMEALEIYQTAIAQNSINNICETMMSIQDKWENILNISIPKLDIELPNIQGLENIANISARILHSIDLADFELSRMDFNIDMLKSYAENYSDETDDSKIDFNDFEDSDIEIAQNTIEEIQENPEDCAAIIEKNVRSVKSASKKYAMLIFLLILLYAVYLTQKNPDQHMVKSIFEGLADLFFENLIPHSVTAYLAIKASNIVRKEPNSKSEIIADIPIGTMIEPIEDKPYYYKVKQVIEENGELVEMEGYISKRTILKLHKK